jgi:hypothetical protein
MTALDPLSDKVLHGRLRHPVFRARVLANSGRRRRVATRDRLLLEALRSEGGFATSLDELGFGTSDAMLAAGRRIAAVLPAATCHDADGDDLAGRNTSLHCFSVDPPELVAADPDVVLWGLEERLLDLAEAYIGLPVAFTTVHLRKDLGNGRQVGTRYWHLDTEDERVLRVIVYLEDVGAADGPFEFIPRALTAAVPELHERARRSHGDPITDDEMRAHVPASLWRPCTGPAGTVAIADNSGCFHHGRVHKSERLALIYTYTSRHPHYPRLRRNAAFDDRLSPRQRAAFFVDTGAGGA